MRRLLVVLALGGLAGCGPALEETVATHRDGLKASSVPAMLAPDVRLSISEALRDPTGAPFLPPACAPPQVFENLPNSSVSVTMPAGCSYMRVKLWGGGGFSSSNCQAANDLKGTAGGGGFVDVELKIVAGEQYSFFTPAQGSNIQGRVALVHKLPVNAMLDGFNALRPIAMAPAGGGAGCAPYIAGLSSRLAGKGGAGGPVGQAGTNGEATWVGNPTIHYLARGGTGATGTGPGAGGTTPSGGNGQPGKAWGALPYGNFWIGGAGAAPIGGSDGDGIFGGGGGASAGPGGWYASAGGGGGSSWVMASWNGVAMLVAQAQGSYKMPGNAGDPDRGTAGEGADFALDGSLVGKAGRIVISFSADPTPAPSVTSILPTSGAAIGGAQVTINGSNFAPGAMVRFGSAPASAVTFVSPTQLIATAPALVAGTLNDVTVQTPASGTLASAFFADFLDVGPGPIHPYVEKVVRNAITAGCGGGNYCPADPVTRAQMAVFLLKAKFGSAYVPPHQTGTPIFSDVATEGVIRDYVEALYSLGVTGGCAPGLYCPNSPVTRQQMAVFLLMTRYGSGYTPPHQPGTPIFSDVATEGLIRDFVEALYNEGVTGGCAPGLYCPNSPVNRGEMAVFLSVTFSLP